MVRAHVLVLGVVTADAHYAMIKPASWQDPDGTAYSNWDHRYGWRAAGCTNHTPPAGEEAVIGCYSQWYSNGTHIPGNRTLPAKAQTYIKTCTETNPIAKGTCAGMQKNPWMAPGSAPVWSPCGYDGGNPQGCPVGNPGGGGCQSGGYGHGPDARTLLGNTKPTEWTAGAAEEAIFGVTANHGGGYSYRLCPKPASGKYMDLTEECFQKTQLRFVGDTQWIQHGCDETNRTEIPAVRIDEGTFPAGSQWTRNPIPACGTFDGGGVLQQVCLGSQFPEPVPGASGFYGLTPNDIVAGTTYQRKLTQFSVVDKVQVPSDLAAGDYVLSFRIDCEQTPQIWSYCGDIHISHRSPPGPSPPGPSVPGCSDFSKGAFSGGIASQKDCDRACYEAEGLQPPSGCSLGAFKNSDGMTSCSCCTKCESNSCTSYDSVCKGPVGISSMTIV